MDKEIDVFYNLLQRNPREKNNFDKKLSEIHSQEDLLRFIDTELIPLAKRKGFYFTIKDFLKYGEQSTRELSEEDLLDVSGGISFISKKMLPLFLAGISFSSNIPITHAAVTECVSSVGKGQDTTQGLEENQVEGYSIKKVLNHCGDIYVCYEHEKTGAQVLAKKGDCMDLTVSFRAPSENDKGTIHVLEHCLVSNLITNDKLLGINGDTDPWRLTLQALSTDKKSIKSLLSQIDHPDFLSDKSIFDRESHYIYKSPYTGKEFSRGRVFVEETNYKADSTERLLNSFMNHDNKLQFVSGGIASEVKKLSYEEVRNAYQKYVHPSNSLTIIRNDNYKDLMKILDEQYFSKYERKDIKVDFNLETMGQENNYSVFEINKADQFNFWDMKNQEDKSSNYKALIGYDLGELSDSECDPFRVKCGAINDKESAAYAKMISKGYKNISTRVCGDGYKKYVRLEVYGDSADLFEKDNLLRNIKELLNESSNKCIPENDYDDIWTYRSSVITTSFQHSFSLYGDPFSENVFTIKDGEIKAATVESITAEENEKVLKKMEIPQEIMVLRKGENASSLSADRKDKIFKANGKISGDPIKDKIVLKVINRFILEDNLKNKGALYNGFSVWNESFETNENPDLEDIKEFFAYDFPKLASSFKLTSDMLDKVKNPILEYSDDESEKEKIENIKAEEIQELIRNIPPIVLEEET